MTSSGSCGLPGVNRGFICRRGNSWSCSLGLSNPEIALGLLNQASQLITMKEDRVQIPRVRLMKAMLTILPPGLDQFYWQNSGGEAVDKALKIAKAYTAQKGVIAFHGCFHGRTHGAVSVTSNPEYRQPFGLLDQDWVTFLGTVRWRRTAQLKTWSRCARIEPGGCG